MVHCLMVSFEMAENFTCWIYIYNLIFETLWGPHSAKYYGPLITCILHCLLKNKCILLLLICFLHLKLFCCLVWIGIEDGGSQNAGLKVSHLQKATTSLWLMAKANGIIVMTVFTYLCDTIYTGISIFLHIGSLVKLSFLILCPWKSLEFH